MMHGQENIKLHYEVYCKQYGNGRGQNTSDPTGNQSSQEFNL
jgi:hypothetical protein